MHESQHGNPIGKALVVISPNQALFVVTRNSTTTISPTSPTPVEELPYPDKQNFESPVTTVPLAEQVSIDYLSRYFLILDTGLLCQSYL